MRKNLSSNILSEKEKSLFFFQNSSFRINSCEFREMQLCESLFFLHNEKMNVFNYFIIENSSFQKIDLISQISLNLINFFGENSDISLKFNEFSEISYFNHLIFIDNFDGNYELSFTNFRENEIISHLFFIENVALANVSNSICHATNMKNGIRFNSGGGVLKVYNSGIKIFQNFTISETFSQTTAFGIKIIDDQNRFKYFLNKKVKINRKI